MSMLYRMVLFLVARKLCEGHQLDIFFHIKSSFQKHFLFKFNLEFRCYTKEWITLLCTAASIYFSFIVFLLCTSEEPINRCRWNLYRVGIYPITNIHTRG